MPRFPGSLAVATPPSSNFSPTRTPKIGVVLHVIEGSAYSALAEFASPGTQLSAHFVVAGPGDPVADGTIWQVLDTDLVAYAQEAGNWAPTSYVAVETSGTTATPLSPAQVASVARIVAWTASLHGFPVVGEVPHGTPGVTTHCNPDGSPDPAWGDHPCPGPLRLAQVSAIVAAALPSFDTDHMEVLMTLASSKTDALNCQIREWWATFRTDTLTPPAVEYCTALYNQRGSIDAVLACIIDTAHSQGKLRAMWTGAA